MNLPAPPEFRELGPNHIEDLRLLHDRVGHLGRKLGILRLYPDHAHPAVADCGHPDIRPALPGLEREGWLKLPKGDVLWLDLELLGDRLLHSFTGNTEDQRLHHLTLGFGVNGPVIQLKGKLVDGKLGPGLVNGPHQHLDQAPESHPAQEASKEDPPVFLQVSYQIR